MGNKILMTFLLFNMGLISAQSLKKSYRPRLKIPAYDCNNLQFVAFSDAFSAVDYCTYPAHKINTKCIAESCPGLRSVFLCPVFINQENTNKILEILTDCLKQRHICNFPINPISIPSVSLNVDQILHENGFSGNCTIEPKSAFIKNIDNTKISLRKSNVYDTTSPTYRVEVPNLVYTGTINCMSGSPISGQLLGMDLVVFMRKVPFNVAMNVTVLSRLNTDEPNVEYSTATMTNSDLTETDMMTWLEYFNIKSAFGDAMKSILDESNLSNAFGNFISAIVNSGFKVSEEHCKIVEEDSVLGIEG